MNESNIALDLMDRKYGVRIEQIENGESHEEYDKISKEDFSRINACFSDMPYILKELYDSKYYEESFKVIYDKGLGTLQKSAKTPGAYRANIVEKGTNNHFTGQAELMKLEPDTIMQINTIVSSAFTVASIATNQYYLKDIDEKFKCIEKTVNEIKQFLEKDKESQIWADGEFLEETRGILGVIIEDDTYRQSTITTLQLIRRTSLSHIKLYYEQLKELKDMLDIKDKDKAASENMVRYRDYLPKLWYSVYIYELAYSMEAYLSKCTDKVYFDKVIHSQRKVMSMYEDIYNILDHEVEMYIDNVKALKANEVPAKILKSAGKFLETFYIPMNPLFLFGAKGLGVIFDKGADHIDAEEKQKKQIKKQEFIDMLQSAIQPYSDTEPFELQIQSVKQFDALYNKKIELIVDNKMGAAYIKTELDVEDYDNQEDNSAINDSDSFYKEI